MNRKLLTLFSLLIFLTACSKDIKLDESFIVNEKFSAYLRGYWGTKEIDLAANDDGFYNMIDGQLSFFDFESNNNLKLSQLTFQDDKPVSVCVSMEKYCSMYNPRFLTFYDDFVYFISDYYSIEGGSSLYLTRVKADGTEYENVIALEGSGYEHVLIKGKLIYKVENTNNLKIVDINAKTHKKISLDSVGLFGKFLSDGDNIVMTTYISEDESTLSKFNFETDEFEELYKTCCGLIDLSGDKILMLIMDEDGESYFGRVSDFAGNVITEIHDQDRFMNFIDDNYIYTSSRMSPQRYVVYDFEGNIVEEYLAPKKYIIDEEEKYNTADNFLELTQIQGVNDDYLFAIGSTSEGVSYVLIDRTTGEWLEIEL